MANIKSAKKRIRVIDKKTARNRRIKNHLKPRDYYGHKGVYGKILHITGCDHYRGAALLAAKAAVYTGSGLVTVWSNEKVIDALYHCRPNIVVKNV